MSNNADIRIDAHRQIYPHGHPYFLLNYIINCHSSFNPTTLKKSLKMYTYIWQSIKTTCVKKKMRAPPQKKDTTFLRNTVLCWLLRLFRSPTPPCHRSRSLRKSPTFLVYCYVKLLCQCSQLLLILLLDSSCHTEEFFINVNSPVHRMWLDVQLQKQNHQ